MKWIEITCYVIDGGLDDLGIDQEEFEVKTFLNVDSIMSVREAADEQIDGLGSAIIHLKSGQSYSSKESYNQVIKMITG